MQALLLNLSAHLTKELGMAPGGEFRTAVREVQCTYPCSNYVFNVWKHIIITCLLFRNK